MADPKVFPILGIDFTVSQPYEAGHPLTEGEARALNQTRKENLGNNFRSAVKKAQDDATAAGTPVDEAKLQSEFSALDGKYEFTLATVGASRKLDPVEREVRTLIKAQLRDQLAAETPPRKLSDLGDDQLEAILEANADNADIVKIAKQIVNSRAKVTGFTLAQPAPAPTEPARAQ